MTTTPPAIACTLGGGDFQQRVAWIASINQRHLRAHAHAGLRLSLSYAPEAAALVREMVERERECCAFLVFDLQERSDTIEVTIDVPENAGAIASDLFAPFLPSGGSVVTGCTSAACTASCGSSSLVSSPDALEPLDETPPPRRLGPVAAMIATGALACGVCCLAPFAFPAVALASTGGVLAWFGRAQGWMTGIALLVVVIAWLGVWRHARRSSRRPAASTLWWMSAASLITIGALLWPSVEPWVIRQIAD